MADKPNAKLSDWLIEVAASLTEPDTHSMRAATVIVECGECSSIGLRGYRDGDESEPDRLVAKAAVYCALKLGGVQRSTRIH